MKRLFGAKILKVALVFVLVVGLICSLALPAMAKNEGKGNPDTSNLVKVNTIKGKVESKAEDGSSFVVTDLGDNQTTIKVDSNTKYYLVQAAPFGAAIKNKIQDKIQDFKNTPPGNPQNNKPDNMPNNMNQRGLGNKNGQIGTVNEEDDDLDMAMENPELEQGLIQNEQGPQGFFNKIKSWFGGWPSFGKAASFEDLEIGDGVVIRVMPNENLAKQVLIVKPSNIKKVIGIIDTVGSDSFMVTPEGGESVTLTFNSDTRVMLKGAIAMAAGQWATVIYKVTDSTNLAVVVDVLLEKPAPKPTPTTESGT
jgi:hypothetical protein